jgi:hypothetical protein
MEKFCLVNHFVLELFSVGGFPLEEASELGYRDNKGIIFGSIVSLCSLFFFYANNCYKILFLLCIFLLVPYKWY